MLVTRFIENVRAEAHEPFDFVGMVLAGVGIAGLAFGLSVLGLDFLPWPASCGADRRRRAGCHRLCAACAPGAGAGARPVAVPAADLPRRASAAASSFRVGVGALPFLLPLLLQLGFGMTPFQSGLITFSTALGAMRMKTIVPAILRRFGFRNVLTWNALISSAFLAACAAFTPATPVGADRRSAARRRLLPLAAIHQHQHHRLCRDRASDA